MKTLLWKELRENLRWALLAMVVFGGALGYALFHSSRGYPDFYYNDGITLCKKPFLLITTFGAPAIALFLGFMQIIPELGRDRWGALLHRPVSRGTLFWGKAVSGVLLYALATIVPFGAAVGLAATPGVFGVPFLPAMMRPGVVDIVIGLAYYFAALTMTLHRGGWPVLRVFPLLAAVHISFFAQGTGLFYVVVEAAVLMVAALLVAAWGAIQHQDAFSRRSALAKLAFLAVAYYGALGLGDVGKSLLVALGPSPKSKVSRYEITRDGRPVILTYENNVVVSVTDVGGKPIDDPKLKPDRVRNQVNSLSLFSYYIGDSHGWKPAGRSTSYRQSSDYLWARSPYLYPRMEQWFQITEPRMFLSYLPAQKLAVDRLDAGGFQSLGAPVKPFSPGVELESLGQDMIVISAPEGVQFAYLASRKIVDIELPAAGPVYGSGSAWASTGQSSVQAVGFALASGMALYDTKASRIAFLPYHRDVGRWGQISVGFNGQLTRFYLRYSPSVWIDAQTKKNMSSFLEIADADGRVLESYELPPLPEDSRGVPLGVTLTRRLQSPAVYLGTIVYRQIGAALGSQRLKNRLASQFGPGWKDTREALIWSGSISFGLSLIALAWARRAHFSWPRALAWAAFVLGFNLAGFIVFCFVADWPRLVACAGCRKSRSVQSNHCASCGASWEVPGLNGSEIFDRPVAGSPV